MAGATGDPLHRYYEMTATRPPRELLGAALRLLDARATTPRLAVDLGCGAGVETIELLRQGWRVLAVDRSRFAIRRLRSTVDADRNARLQTKVRRAESLRFPPAHLVWAGYSLPYLAPSALAGVWQAIVESLEPGGLFAGDFFGPRHDWAGTAGMSFLSEREVRKLCRPLVVESFVCERGRRMTPLNGLVRVQSFGVIARKPERP